MNLKHLEDRELCLSLSNISQAQSYFREVQKANPRLNTDAKLEELRCLLGAKGANLKLSELIEEMTQISITSLKKQKFGQKRVHAEEAKREGVSNEKIQLSSAIQSKSGFKTLPTPTSESKPARAFKNPRYIPGALRFELWLRDKGQCVKCGGRRNINIDHIRPLALGGLTELNNLRLLCFHCNQRQAIKGFGVRYRSKIRQPLPDGKGLLVVMALLE